MQKSDDTTNNGQSNAADMPVIHAPPSKQHTTAGPYSPVLVVSPGKLVVICGQAALDMDGKLVSEDFDAQARTTLDNCLKQLQFADCDMSDVFKVNVYLTDLADWPSFNEIYRGYMPKPRPVRTAIQSGLLHKFRVEVEMWAAKP